jgi:hypothetical protein
MALLIMSGGQEIIDEMAKHIRPGRLLAGGLRRGAMPEMIRRWPTKRPGIIRRLMT